MLVFLNSEKTISLDEIVCIYEKKKKKNKTKTIIIDKEGRKIADKNNINIIIKRIEKQNGFLK